MVVFDHDTDDLLSTHPPTIVKQTKCKKTSSFLFPKNYHVACSCTFFQKHVYCKHLIHAHGLTHSLSDKGMLQHNVCFQGNTSRACQEHGCPKHATPALQQMLCVILFRFIMMHTYKSLCSRWYFVTWLHPEAFFSIFTSKSKYWAVSKWVQCLGENACQLRSLQISGG